MGSKRKRIQYKNSIKLERAIDLNQERNHRLSFSSSSMQKETLLLISIKHSKEMLLAKFNPLSNLSIRPLIFRVNINKEFLLI
jgi:hypothetical protein